MQYACIAATKKGARCRNFVKVQGTMCPLHQKMVESGKEVRLAPAPDTVLIRFRVNQKWVAKLREAGVRTQPLRWLQKEQKHVRQAERLSRKPYRLRNIADSGVPVFGPDGISRVSMEGLLEYLISVDYRIADAHLLRTIKKAQQMGILVLVLSRQQPAIELPFFSLLSPLLSSSWGYAHIWANPPQEDGKVVHTVNLSHRLETPPELELWFDDGLWAVRPAS